ASSCGSASPAGASVAAASAVSASRGVPSSTGVSFSVFVINLSYQSGERLCGEIHHGYDARVVQARRADNPDDADDAPIRSAIGRGDNRRARERKELILRPDEDTGRTAIARAVEKLRNVLLGLELVEELPYPVEVADRIFVEQIGLPAHDQHRTVGAVRRPDREPARHEIGGGAVDR